MFRLEKKPERCSSGLTIKKQLKRMLPCLIPLCCSSAGFSAEVYLSDVEGASSVDFYPAFSSKFEYRTSVSTFSTHSGEKQILVSGSACHDITLTDPIPRKPCDPVISLRRSDLTPAPGWGDAFQVQLNALGAWKKVRERYNSWRDESEQRGAVPDTKVFYWFYGANAWHFEHQGKDYYALAGGTIFHEMSTLYPDRADPAAGTIYLLDASGNLVSSFGDNGQARYLERGKKKESATSDETLADYYISRDIITNIKPAIVNGEERLLVAGYFGYPNLNDIDEKDGVDSGEDHYRSSIALADISTGELVENFGTNGSRFARFDGFLRPWPQDILIDRSQSSETILSVNLLVKQNSFHDRTNGDRFGVIKFSNTGSVITNTVLPAPEGTSVRAFKVIPCENECDTESILVWTNHDADSGQGFYFQKLKATGELDTDFGSEGTATVILPQDGIEIYDVILESGYALFTGEKGGKDFRARYKLSDGSIDEDFGDYGSLTTSVEGTLIGGYIETLPMENETLILGLSRQRDTGLNKTLRGSLLNFDGSPKLPSTPEEILVATYQPLYTESSVSGAVSTLATSLLTILTGYFGSLMLK